MSPLLSTHHARPAKAYPSQIYTDTNVIVGPEVAIMNRSEQFICCVKKNKQINKKAVRAAYCNYVTTLQREMPPWQDTGKMSQNYTVQHFHDQSTLLLPISLRYHLFFTSPFNACSLQKKRKRGDSYSLLQSMWDMTRTEERNEHQLFPFATQPTVLPLIILRKSQQKLELGLVQCAFSTCSAIIPPRVQWTACCLHLRCSSKT